MIDFGISHCYINKLKLWDCEIKINFFDIYIFSRIFYIHKLDLKNLYIFVFFSILFENNKRIKGLKLQKINITDMSNFIISIK